ncbi:transposase [Streptomyces sp. NBC_01476]|uniref:IS110 family transposase n=1 Tax=Streptomyces sp. NBC_01476 TaxID=2903881 RepID=UPI002E3302E7|nr:transposase [Streptomyces sp. NBC_01476]
MFAGVDWADRWVDCAVIRRDGTRLGHRRIVYAQSADPVGDYASFLRSFNRTRWRSIPTAIEDVGILFAQNLTDHGLTVIHVDATLAARARKAGSAGGDTKADHTDAYLLAGMFRTGNFAPRRVSSAAARAVQVLARAQTDAARRRVEALHQLRAALVTYYPAATTAWPKAGLRHPQARAVLAAAPSPRAAAALSPVQFAQALRTGGRWRTVEDEVERLHLHFRRPALRTHPAVEEARAAEARGLLADLDHACSRADDMARQAAEAFSAHPSHKIITSFPGIGDLLGSRLLGETGDHPHRFADARALCAYAGVVPVTWAPGTAARVSMRRAVNSELRDALYQGAPAAAPRSPGTWLARRAGGADRPARPGVDGPVAHCSPACQARPRTAGPGAGIGSFFGKRPASWSACRAAMAHQAAARLAERLTAWHWARRSPRPQVSGVRAWGTDCLRREA